MLSRNLVRMFHISAPRLEETRYSINGIEMTRSDVLKVHPTDRTVAQWAILVDWDLQRTRQYVVVDPMDPQGLLYLNHAEYLSQMKVCASASLMLIVVARPGSARPVPSITSTSSGSSDDSSQNSPWGVRIESKWSKSSKTSWKQFVTLRNRISRLANRKVGSSMASETNATIARTVYVWVQQLSHWAEVKNPGTYIRYFIPLVLHLEKLLKDNGQMAAVTFLKVSLFTLYSYISGNPLKSTVPLGIGIRLTHGLPRVLDKDLRLLVRKGHMPSIRILASLLNLYRALEAPHPDFSVETIRKSHPVMDGQIWEDFQRFCRLEWPRMLEAHLGYPLPSWKYQSGLYHLVTSAGANATGVAMMAITRDARAWDLQPQNHMLNWFRLNGDEEALRMMATSAREYHFPQEWVPSKEGEAAYSQAEILESLKSGKQLPRRDPLGSHPTYSRFFWGTRDRFSTTGVPEGHPIDSKEGVHAPILGRLHAIDEPAGKVRVVAIADYWTQVGMKPVHEHLFNILKDIKQDATFDQTGRVDEYFKENLSPHWSFDLKSATDLIPLALYKEVLTPLFLKKDGSYSEARELIELWSQVLTDRDWLLPDGSGFVRYGTGQPMGALSSWASMAIVHHALVQFSSWRTGRTTWFSSYRVLGDDVDISKDRLVAENYQSSCSAFHIIIGLLKSLRSERNVFEFANQRFCPEGNISPLSYKEELQAQSWSGRLEFARRILARFGTSLSDKTAALIRKAATDTQWRVLHSELSGLRPAVLRSLFGFCLINPFQNWKELTIDSLLEWLLPVLPSDGRDVVTSSVRTTNRLDHFMRVFTTRLLEYTRDQLKSKLASAPAPFAIRPVRLEQPKIQTLVEFWVRDYLFLPIYGEKGRDHSMAQEELNRLLSGFYSPFDGKPGYIVRHPRKENLNRNSKFTVLYTIACISKRNEQVIDTMKKLLKKVETSLNYVDHEFMIYFNMKVRNEVMNPFRAAIQYYAEFCELSDIVVPDFGKPMSAWLKTEKEVTPASGVFSKALYVRPETEVIPVPGSAIQLALQECFGVAIPGIPLVRLSGLMSSNKGKWMRRLLAAAKSYEMNAAVHTALNCYMAKAQREIRWSRRGGRIELRTGS